MSFEESKLVRINGNDYEELKKIKDKTGVPIIKLIEFAIPMLKRKYRIKDEPKEMVFNIDADKFKQTNENQLNHLLRDLGYKYSKCSDSDI